MSDVPADATTSRGPSDTAPQAPDEAGNYKSYRRNVWRKSWLQSVVPWATSFVVHVALLAVALSLLVTYKVAVDSGPVVEPANIASAKLAETNVGATPNVGNVDDVTRQNASLNPVEQSTDFRSQGDGESTNDLLAATSGGAMTDSATGVTGMGELSDALGGGGGEGSPLFGEPGGGDGFMGMGMGGDGSNVTNIVFVCDSSGSMGGEKQFLLFQEIRNAIAPLEIEQAFNIVFFSGDGFSVAFPGELKPASPRFMEEAGDFLDTVNMTGQTNPIPALEAAFAMKPAPQLIFFLSDGDFDGVVQYQDVVSTIERLNSNATPPVMINTIQFIDKAEAAEDVLKRIASMTGGDYQYVDRNFFDN